MKPLKSCKLCPLYDQPIVNNEINGDLNNIDLIVIAEAPSKEEIKYGKPLSGGDSARGFRPVFENLKLNTYNYIITNSCKCSNIVDGKTVNPPKEAILTCRENLVNLILKTRPKTILTMGGTALKSLELSNKRISECRGNFHTFKNITTMITWHPRYFQMNGGVSSIPGKQFINDLTILKEYIDGQFK